MRTFELRSDPETSAAPPVIRVHREESVTFIMESARKRSLNVTSVNHTPAGFDITIAGDPEDVEDVRDEFNSRPLRPAFRSPWRTRINGEGSKK